jgi:Pyridoxamine 5'-phosphate oxidase
MSVGVALDELRSVLAELERAPYLVTVSDDGRPHAVAVPWGWRDDDLEVPAGNRTVANATARPDVTLLWPANDAGGYTLIVDGTAVHTEGTGTGDNRIRVRPTRAVLHRPATGPTDTACGADCVPLTGEASERPAG